jgi:hypothetical protein
MSKFRETNWFKRGELVADIEEQEGGNTELPIEDRYLDQGTTSREDSKMFGIHTGVTTQLPRISKPLLERYPATTTGHDPEYASTVIACDPRSVPELQRMIAELKQRNRTIMAMCGAALVGLVAFAAVVV